MLYKISAKYRVSRWETKICPCCGQETDEAIMISNERIVNEIQEGDSPADALNRWMDAEALLENEIEWLRGPDVIELPQDQYVRLLGAPALPGLEAVV
ncbi:MAG TPA: hypothetical protein ENJ31_01515 [Anaerolineae bacterium]|nr:hypothetical protein [Anaerolineae bacterium]